MSRRMELRMMNEIIYPNYSKSLINISASICKYYGVDTGHKTIPIIDEVLSKGYKNIVLMLFDGMGVDCIENNLTSGSFIIKNMIDTILSVYPSTTTAATIALESGLAPIEHGWLGWSLYFKEIDKIVNLFPNTTRDDKIAADYHVARKFLPLQIFFLELSVQQMVQLRFIGCHLIQSIMRKIRNKYVII